MWCPARARPQVAISRVDIHRALLARGLAQILNFTQYRSAIGRKKFFSDANEADDAAVGRDSEGIGHEMLNQRGVAFVGRRLDLGWKGGNGQDVGGVKGAGEEEAGRVSEGDEDGGSGAVVALGEVLGEVSEEKVFVFDLRKRLARRRNDSQLEPTYNDIGPDFGRDHRELVNLISS